MNDNRISVCVDEPIDYIAIPIKEYEHLKDCEHELKMQKDQMIATLRNSMFNHIQQTTISNSCANTQYITDIFKTI